MMCGSHAVRGAHDGVGIARAAGARPPTRRRSRACAKSIASALRGAPRLAQDRRAARVAVLQVRPGVAVERHRLVEIEVDVLVALRREVREHDRADADLARDRARSRRRGSSGLTSAIFARTSSSAIANTSRISTTLPQARAGFLPPTRTSPYGTCSQRARPRRSPSSRAA